MIKWSVSVEFGCEGEGEGVWFFVAGGGKILVEISLFIYLRIIEIHLK